MSYTIQLRHIHNKDIIDTAKILGINEELLNKLSIQLPESIQLIKNLSELLKDYSDIPDQLQALISDTKQKITYGITLQNSHNRYCKFAMREVPKYEIKNDVCTICLKKLKDDVVDIVCGHQFHYSCINNYVDIYYCCHLCQKRYPY
jgi:hypothetical protein